MINSKQDKFFEADVAPDKVLELTTGPLGGLKSLPTVSKNHSR
jgi:hypothetical protein